MGDERIEELIRRLGAEEERASRAAGEELLRLGARAVPALRQALSSEQDNVRKAAAYLLGKAGGDGHSTEALTRALSDSSPKVRKNAAVSLGQLEDESAVGPLARALAGETVEWVRASMILALGKIGGAAAREALSGHQPASEAEREALRKGLDRLSGPMADVSWRPGAQVSCPIFATAPPGLEDITVAEALERGLPRPEPVGPGLLQFRGVDHPGGALSALRCVLDIRLLAGQEPPLGERPAIEVPRMLARALEGADLLANWRDLLATDEPALRYRFSLEGIRVPKVVFLETLATARDKLARWGLVDSPSSYAVLLRVEVDPEGMRVWLVPTFEANARFAYRKADVGASIDPVVGACLARVVRRAESGVAVDPTCGSGTLLIERALLDPGLRLVGLDISPTAIRAARTNIEAAGLSQRISVRCADAGDASSWPACREVLANLPFGWRSRQQDRDLAGLYRKLTANLARSLEPGGRAVLYTTNARALRPALAKVSPPLVLRQERTVQSGGLSVGAWVVERARDTRR